MIRKLLGLVLFLLFISSISWGQCPPNASVTLGPDQFVCANSSVTLTSTISSAPTGNPTYSWTGPNISGQSATTLAVPVNQSGTYSVSIAYGNNCVLTDQVVVTFLPVPTISPSQCIASGASANLSVTINPALPVTITPTYSWTGPNGFTSSLANPSIPSFNATKAGTYNVTVSFISSSGNQCTYNLSTILNLTPATPSFSIPANGCLGTNYSPTGFTAQPNTTYSWTVTPVSSSSGLNGPTPVFNFTNSGSYSVSVTATQNGCSATSSGQGISILFLGINNPDIAPTSSPNSFLAPPVLFGGAQTYKICGSNNVSSVQIYNDPPSANNSGTIYTLTWGTNPGVSFPGGSTTSQSILIGNNPFTINATYGGCSTSINYNIYVGSNPYVSVGVGNSIGLCPGQNVVANITPVDQQGQQNSPGTTYDLYFSNNPNTIVQSFLDLTATTAAQPIVFNQSSCGTTATNNCYPSQSNVYYAYVVATNACDNSCASSPAITVNDKPDANFTVSATTVCPNASVTLTNTGSNGNTVTGNATQGYTCSTTTKIKYVITPNTGFTVTTGSLGGSSPNFNSWSGTNVVVLNFTNPGTYTIKQYAQSNNCGPDSLIKTICVINQPTSSIATQSATTFCSPASVPLSSNSTLPMCGTSAIPVSYSWTVTNPTNCSSCSNTISSPSSANSNFTFINNSNAVQTFTVSLNVTPLDPITNQPLSNPSCAHSSSITIQVYPAVQITPLTTCNGTLNWNLNNQVNVPSTFTWQATPNNNVSGESTTLQNSSTINDALVNTSTSAQTVSYTVNATSITGGCTTSNTFTVNLVTPLIVQPLSNQTICVGGGLSTPSPLNLLYSGGSGTATFSWILNSTGSPISTSSSYSPPTFNTPGTFVYTGTVTSGPTGCVQNASQNATITVVADPTISTQPTNATYCLNASPVTPLSVVATGGNGAFSYQWYSNNSNSTTGGQLIPNATSSSYTPPNSSTGTTYYYCIISQTGLNCSVTSNVAQVVVNPAPIVTTQPQSQTICIGGTLSALSVAYSGGSGTATYQWYSNSSAANTGGTILNGETNPTFNLPSGLNNTAAASYYYCVINFGSGSGCSVITSNVATISVLTDPTFSVQPNPSQTICEGGSVSGLTATISGGSGTSSYQWYSVNGSTYTPITTNGTSASYSPPTFGAGSAGTYNYALLVTQSVSGCASTYSANATVIVVADPSVSAPVGASYCQNASPVTPLTVTASGGASTNYSYQWFSGANSINGATSSSYTPPVTSTGTSNYTCLVTIAPPTSGCSVTSTAAAITVTAGPAFTTQPQSQTICIGGTLSALGVAYSGGSGTPTYQWYSNSSAANTGGTILNGETNPTFNLPSGLNNTAAASYYYCVINFGSGSGCSVITSNVATISVLTDPTFSVQPNPSQTICEGGSVSGLTATISGGSGTSSYQWYTVNGSTYTPITTNGTSASYSPPTFGAGSAGTYNYALLITQSVSGCASTYSANATVIVVADPNVTAPVGASYCQNASPVTPLTVTASNGNGSAYTYQWFSNSTNSNSGGTPQANSNSPTFTPPVNGTGTLYYYCLVTSSPTNSGCSTPSATATITVTAGPAFTTQPLSQTICVGGSLSALSVAYSGGSGTPTYQWYSNSSAANTGGTILNGETNPTFNLPSGLNNTAAASYYYCVINFGSGSGCSVITSNVATISVLTDPTFSVQPNPSQTICEGGSVSGLTATISGGSGTSSYQWYTVNGSTYTPITTNGTSASYSPPTFGAGSAGTYNYALLITQSVSGCASTYSANATVIVVADPSVSAPVGASYCQNASPVTPLTVTASGGASTNYSYQWFSGANSINGATSSSYTPPVTSTGTSNYTCLVTIAPPTSGCSVTSTAAAITVTAGPAFTTQPQSQTICIGGTLSALGVAYSGGSGTPTYQWYSNSSAANTGGTILNGETNPTFNLPSGLNNTAAASYYYCVINFGSGSGCSVITSNVATISVLTDPTFSVQPNPSQTICEGGSVSGLTATISGGSGTSSYQWYTVNGSTYTPITTNGTSASYSPPTFGAGSAGTYNYALLITQSVSGCASTYSANATVIVVADPSVSAPVGASYCQNASPVTPLTVTASGGASTNYSYQWFSGANSINGATSSSYTPPVTSTGTSNYTCLVTIAPPTSGCSVTSAIATITVNSAPTFATQPLASQTVCLDGTFSALSVTTQNGTGTPTFQWYSNTTSSTSGGTAISGATSANYTPPATSVGTTYYYCVATFASGGCSNITSALAAAIVVADPTISIQPLPSQSICVGGNIATPLTVTASGGTGSYSYQWSTAAGQIPGAINQNYTPQAFTTVGQFTYTVSVSQSGSGCNAMTSQNAVIDVIADPIVSNQPVGAAYCQNASPVAPLSVSATGGIGAFSYQWYSNTANNNTNGSLIPGATSSTFTPSVATAGTTYYYCVITQTGLNCGVTSNTAEIIVNLAPTFATQPLATQTVCLDGTFSALTVTTQNGTGTPTFQWFSNTASSNSGGAPISGATSASYTPPSNAVGNTYYYCIATFATGGCSNITSTIATAIVVADPLISTQPIASQSICVGGTIGTPMTVTATGGTGSYSYQWSNATGAITGATNQNFTPTSFTTVGQYNYTVTITQSGSGCNALSSQNALIEVVADPIVSTQPINAAYCQNASPIAPLSVSATGGIGTFSYQWYSNTANNNTNGSLIPGATSSTFSPPVAIVGTMYYYCVITQTGLNCGVTSNTAEIIVNLAPTFATQPLANQTVCLDGTFSALTVTTQNGTGTPTFQWYSNTTGSTSGGTPIPGASSASFTPPATAVGTAYYYCVATYATGGCTAITSALATAIVVADPTIIIQPIPAQSICVGGNIANALTVTVAGGTGTTSYQWSTSTGLITGATNQSYNPPPFNIVGAFTYYVTISLSGSGCNVISSQDAIIDVVADPIVSTQPISAAYCQNGSPVSPLTVAATGGLGSFSYQWYSNTLNSNSGGTLIPGATSSSYTPSVASVGVMYYYCVLTQTGLNCGVTSNAASTTVSLAPTYVLQPISQTICTGGTFAPISVTYQDGTGVPSYQWFSNSTNSYSGAVAISGATNSTFQPSAANLGTIYYFCEISFSFGGCSSISSNISNQTVVADPIISVEPQVTQSICVGGTIPAALSVTVTGGTGTITYQWFAGTNQVSGATQSTFLPSNFNTPGTFLFTANISISGVGCDALISQPAQVIVVEDPSVTQPLTAIYCQNASPITPLQVSVSGGLGTNSYQWYFSAANTTSGGTAIAGANTSSYIPSVATVGTAYYYCIVNQSAPNCATTSANAPIQVNIPPTISSQPLATQTLCEGGSPTLLQVAYINGTNSATYQWYTNNINSNTGGTPIANATTASYNPQSIILGTTFYYCVITFQQGGCSSLTTIAAQVTIVGDPAITAQPLANQEICQGNTINNALTFNYAGGTGNATIAWYLAATPPVLINGVSTNTYLPIPFNVADTFNYFATLTFDGVGCNVINTLLAEIIVHPTPYATNLNDTLVVCNNSNLSIPLTATVTSTFSWQTQLTAAVNGESFLPQTSYSIDDSLSNTTTSSQFLTYTVTPTSFPYGCVGPDSTVVVQLQPDVILSMNQAMEICSGSPVNGILTSNVPSTFNWFVSIDNPNVTGESILPSTNWLVNDVLVNTSTVNQVVVYSVFPVSIQGQCPGLAQPLVVTVKPPIDLLNPDTLTICSGQNTGINLVANTNVQFNWYASPSLNVSGETTSVINSPFINDVLVNPTNAVEVVTYNVIGTSTANGCSSPVLPLYVVVNPVPSLVNLNPLTICNGNYLYPYSLQTSVVGATTNWSVLNNPIGIPSTFGSNTLPGFIANNNTIITQTGQIQITPIYTNNNVTCIGNDTTLLIPVLPTPSVNPLADITACNLTQIPLTPVSGPVPNTVYEWYNANVSLGLNASGIGDIPTFVGLNNSTLPVSGTVTVAPSYTQNNITCQGTPIDFEMTINPSPTLLNSNIEICDGEFTNVLLNANIPSTFQWNANIQGNVYNETAAPVQNNAFINDQLVLATATAQTVTYNVTPISAPYGCIGFDTTILVQVNPLPVVDFSVITPILCDQSQINFQNNSVGSLDFTWTFGDGDSSFLFNPVHEYANFGSFLVTLNAVDQLTGCFNSADQTIIIHESPEADFLISDTLACGSLDVTFNALDLNPNWSYLWTFGDGTSSNQYGLAGHQYVTNGCFDINLQISTPEGCVSDTTQLDAICVYPEPIAAFTMDDPVVSSLTPEVQFFNSSLFADSYLWEFGDGTTSQTENPNHLFPSDPATYVIILTASNNVGCQDTAALSVTIWQDLAIYVPNTFTPDGDEFNQTFKPVLTEGFKKDSYKLMIFNRWGQVVFVSEDYNIGWDGTYGSNGNISQDGTYTWKIEVTELQSGETRRFLGHVNLIR